MKQSPKENANYLSQLLLWCVIRLSLISLNFLLYGGKEEKKNAISLNRMKISSIFLREEISSFCFSTIEIRMNLQERESESLF